MSCKCGATVKASGSAKPGHEISARGTESGPAPNTLAGILQKTCPRIWSKGTFILENDGSGVRNDRCARERGIGGIRRRMALAAALEQRPALERARSHKGEPLKHPF